MTITTARPKPKSLITASILILTPLFFALANNAVAQRQLGKPLHESQRLIIENIDLTLGEFYSAYMGENLVERRYAEMYLLGVMDATEGTQWCDYRTFKSITISSNIHTPLKAAYKTRPNERASTVIREILANEFACRRQG